MSFEWDLQNGRLKIDRKLVNFEQINRLGDVINYML